jgi:voltage-gated potassium channel Kch
VASSNQPALLNPLLVGIASALCTIFVQGLVVRTIAGEVRRDLKRGRLGARFATDLLFIAAATILALLGHLVEIGIWALVFEFCGEFSNFATAFYHSAVNFTTLGYGDVVMSARWKLLGPLEAADGMLMFGVTTALIFTLVQRLIQTRMGPLER